MGMSRDEDYDDAADDAAAADDDYVGDLSKVIVTGIRFMI